MENGVCGSALFYSLPFIEEQNRYNQSFGPLTGLVGPILPGTEHVEPPNAWRGVRTGGLVKSFVAPADPTSMSNDTPTSYFVNREVFTGTLKIEFIGDGTSNTFLVGEGYVNCQNPAFVEVRGGQWNIGEVMDFDTAAPLMPASAPLPGNSNPYAPSFGRNLPTAGLPTPPTIPFQPQPAQGTCDHRLLQGLTGTVVMVGLADGSVRSVTPAITLTTWNAAITPNGGEILGSDW